MISRRGFLETSTAALAGLALSGRRAFAVGHIPLGVQLYTVRTQAESDLPAVLKQIHFIGYQEVELYWNVYTHSAKDLRAMLAANQLKAPSGHFDYSGLDGKFEYAKDLGLDWIVCPMLPKPAQTSLQGFHAAAAKFNEWGKRAKQQGQRFAFHNHNYEFKDLGGSIGYDILLKETDPDLVWFEMDCYWIAQSGHDPVAMLHKLGSRVKMVHVKDRLPGFATSQQLDVASEHFAPVGHGSLPWKSILSTTQQLGIEHYFVEQDTSQIPPVEAIHQSYAYLRPLLP